MPSESGHRRYHHRAEKRLASSFSSSSFSDERFNNHNNKNVVDDNRGYAMNSSSGLHFPSLSSSSNSSFPSSRAVPHLRHHHHTSRNHGINGSTSPFLRLTHSHSQSAKDTTLGLGSGSGSTSSESISMNRSNSSELRQGSTSVGGGGGRSGGGLYGETDTFSETKSLNRFLSSSSSSSSSSKLSSSGSSSSSSLWTSLDMDMDKMDRTNKNFSNLVTTTSTTTQPHQNYHHYNPLTSHSNHSSDYGMNYSTNISQSFANATASAFEQFVGDHPNGSIRGGVNSASFRNFGNDGSRTFPGLNNSLFNLSSAEEIMMSGFRTDDVNGSTDNYYFENSSSMNMSIIGNMSESGGGGGGGMDSAKIQLYAIIVPVMTFFCVLAVLVNLMIVISARWCRKPMSPTLYFSISLALADAYAAFILATGLFINSFMPTVLKIRQSACISLIIEAFRQGGILVIVCHLLSLAMNHWIGIVRPLHYAATMTRRTAWTVIIFSWICPITVIFIYYSSVPGEGFQSEGCTNYEFLKERTYRAFFASCFFAPLILMSFIYIHIFIIVRNHHTHRQRYQSTQQLKRNVKAVLTTMLVLGTYIIGWMPATVFSLIACKDCMYHPDSFSLKTRYAVYISINLLVILKTLVDPVIYAARMSDIQMALKKMRYEILFRFCKSCAPPEPPNDRGYYLNSPSARTCSKFNRSFYDTKSMRMSSFGSRSSSRRMTGGNAAANCVNTSLLLQSNGNQMHHHHNHNNIPNQHSHKLNEASGTVGGGLGVGGGGAGGGVGGGGSGGANGYAPCPASDGGKSHTNGSTPSSNGNNRKSLGQCSQAQLLINSKSAFEMSEMN